MKSELVSIIVFCYKNYELSLNCLNSVFLQTYENIELIMSDDGSEDFDEAKAKAYIDENKSWNIKNVIINKNGANVGSVRHLNKALGLATGRYVMFIPGNDEYNNKDSVKDMISGFNDFSDDVKVLHGRVEMRDFDLKETLEVQPEEIFVKKFNQIPQSEILEFMLQARHFMWLSPVVFKREAFDLIGGFDETYTYAYDLNLFASFAEKQVEMRHLGVICTNNRDGGLGATVNTTSLTRAHKKVSLEMIQVLERLKRNHSFKQSTLMRILGLTVFFLNASELEHVWKMRSVELQNGVLVDVEREQNTNCVIFGCGVLGSLMPSYLSEFYNILAYTDNNPAKWGENLNGLPIVSPSNLKQFKDFDIVVCINRDTEEIMAQLGTFGLCSHIVLPQIFFDKANYIMSSGN